MKLSRLYYSIYRLLKFVSFLFIIFVMFDISDIPVNVRSVGYEQVPMNHQIVLFVMSRNS